MSKHFHVLCYYSLQEEQVNKTPSSSSTTFPPSCKEFTVGNLNSQLIKGHTGKDCKIQNERRKLFATVLKHSSKTANMKRFGADHMLN